MDAISGMLEIEKSSRGFRDSSVIWTFEALSVVMNVTFKTFESML